MRNRSFGIHHTSSGWKRSITRQSNAHLRRSSHMTRPFDACLRDHFGLRQALIRTHKDLTTPMLAASSGG